MDIQDILPHSDIEEDGFEFQKCWIMDTSENKVHDKECLYEKRCVACVCPVIRRESLHVSRARFQIWPRCSSGARTVRIPWS